MKKVLIPVLFLFITLHVKAQKVASYFTGTPGEGNYESFSFWIENSERSFVSYAYGTDRKEAKVSYAGKGNFKGVDCFKIQFNNKLVLYVMKNGDQLQIADNSGNYLKTFKWEYEGPVNGVGTSCNVCAADDKEAMEILTNYYLK